MATKTSEAFQPAKLISTNSDSSAHYREVNVKAPIMSGIRIKCFAWALESRIFGKYLLQYLKDANLITEVFTQYRYHEPPLCMPQYSSKVLDESSVIQLDPHLSSCERLSTTLECLPLSSSQEKSRSNLFKRWTIQDYSRAYKSGDITPSMVAERFLSAVKETCESSTSMGFFINYYEDDILKQAELSTMRYQKGIPISILDGVPIAIKDEIDCLPYPTTGGTKWLHKLRKVEDDAVCVKRLRECGAVLVGKTNMHELGMGTSGINPHYGASRNPYNRTRWSGGSSGGSAAVVAAGLCPAALGVDGGGSVRMPSALCGIVGLKGTFGRISSNGVLPLNWSVGNVGIHAATVEDSLIVYTVIHGHLPSDHIISIPPSANLPLLTDKSDGMVSQIGDIKFAKYTRWFTDSDSPIHETCLDVLCRLQEVYGCKVVEVTLPEIEEMRLGHYVTIASETNTSLGLDYAKWGRKEAGYDVRAGFSVYSSLTSLEYIAAQRLRYRQMHYHMDIFEKADIIVTPTTGCTARVLNPGADNFGELNYVDGAKLMRYQIAGNFLGLPAISVPVGYDNDGLPIGLQLLGCPWSEATLLRVAFVIQRLVESSIKRPEVYYDLLSHGIGKR